MIPLLPSHTPPYLQMDVAVFELRLSNQGSFHGSKLCAFWDPPFGEHPSQKPVYVEHQGQAGSCPGQHWPVGDRMQRSMFGTHRGMCVITLFTPYNAKSERTRLSGRHSWASSEDRALSLVEHLWLSCGNIYSNNLSIFKNIRESSLQNQEQRSSETPLKIDACLFSGAAQYEYTFLGIKGFNYYC